MPILCRGKRIGLDGKISPTGSRKELCELVNRVRITKWNRKNYQESNGTGIPETAGHAVCEESRNGI